MSYINCYLYVEFKICIDRSMEFLSFELCECSGRFWWFDFYRLVGRSLDMYFMSLADHFNSIIWMFKCIYMYNTLKRINKFLGRICCAACAVYAVILRISVSDSCNVWGIINISKYQCLIYHSAHTPQIEYCLSAINVPGWFWTWQNVYVCEGVSFLSQYLWMATP